MGILTEPLLTMKKQSNSQCDLVILNASELLTLAGALHRPKTGGEMRELGLIQDGGLAIEGCEFVAVGPSREIESKYAGKAKRIIGLREGGDARVCRPPYPRRLCRLEGQGMG